MTDPYRFFNIDYYMHRKDDARGEYGSIPYITGHSETKDASLLWVNSADTWTDLVESSFGNKMTANFVSESGVLELFLFSSDSPKLNSLLLLKLRDMLLCLLSNRLDFISVSTLMFLLTL